MFTVVDESGAVVREVGAPFDAATADEARREVESTFGPLPNGWQIVDYVPEHDAEFEGVTV